MANFNEIDDLFKNRFEGYKDHSVNPSEQWAAFENQLNAGSNANKISTGISSMKMLSMAASVAVILSLGLISQSDVNHTLSQAISQIEDQTNLETNESPFAPVLNEMDVSDDFASIRALESKSIWRSENTVEASGYGDFLSSSNGSIEQESSALLASTSFDQSLDEKADRSIFDNSQLSYANLRADLNKMPALSISLKNAELAETNKGIDFLDYAAKSGLGNDFFVRLGVRFGNGESNNKFQTNNWTANAMASVGFKKAIKDNMGWMLELAYLRRSGNGLERNQNLEVERLYTAFNNSFNAGTNSNEITPSFTIDRSIIATRLDYVQLPLSMYYDANQKLSFNAGAYADFLLRASNATYLVYNQKDYVSRTPNEDELNSREGLNRFRYGLSAGANYEIMNNLSLDLRTMVPLNSPFNSTAEVCASRGAKQSLDLMIGLRYSI
ncbi:MAG: PorT family protein [Salibacteraceae bacterium]|nr:PorT family protein [Salibacteraceae bacterium]MDP4964532.1 PorT family protein [Salibacteraceae bacterium]